MGLLTQDKAFKIQIDPQAAQIVEFKKIIDRDKTKDKTAAIQDLSIIYMYADYKSPYAIYPKEERITKVSKAFGKPASWKPDAALSKAMEVYEQLQVTPSMASLNAIKNSLTTSTMLIERLQGKVKFILDSGADAAIDADMGEAISTVTSLLTLADKLPKAIKNIEDLEEKVKKEQSAEQKLRGGGSVGMFEED
jgi:hypothetical protein